MGLIPDGTRRWSKGNNFPYPNAYWVTMKNIADAIDVAFDRGIKIMTVYLLSSDNFDRSKRDLEVGFSNETRFFRTLLPKIVENHKCRVICAGSIDKYSDKLPEDYKSALADVCEKSKKYRKHTLNLLVAYNPIDELKHAVKKDLENFMNHLWVKDAVDMLIRTGKEKRLSNFIPLQCGYAEVDVINKYFPDITKRDITNSIEEYHDRKRRFGT